jgi:cell division septum initiation protein DivIVA
MRKTGNLDRVSFCYNLSTQPIPAGNSSALWGSEIAVGAHFMTDQELRKLSRAELLKMMIQLSLDNEQLTEENKKLKEQAESREINIEELGSIAEASLKINGVMESAQKAADQYVENVKRVSQKTIDETRAYCQKLINEAQARSDALNKTSKEAEEEQWNRTKEKLDQYVRTHKDWEQQIQNVMDHGGR